MDVRDVFNQLTKGAVFKRKSTKKVKSEDVSSVSIKVEEAGGALDEINQESILSNHTESKKRKAEEKLKSMDPKKKKLLHDEKINEARNKLKIKVAGTRVPDLADSFESMNFSEDLLQNLTKCGYTKPTTIQMQAMLAMVRNRQLLACAPTGSGKTVAFLMPIIQSLKEPQSLGFRAVVLCPTRELAKQTQLECIRLSEGRDFRIHILGKVNNADYGPKSSQKYDILITTPNRLCYLLRQDPPGISLNNVEWLVIDEADRLFESSNKYFKKSLVTVDNSFRGQLEHILKATTHPNRKIAMFSATQTRDVATWCRKNMKNAIRVSVGNINAATTSVHQELLYVGNEAGKLLAIRNIIKEGIKPPVLVFVQSKERAQELFTEMMFDGVNVDAIHADRTQSQRDQTVKSFREGKVWILICTELMARGIDFKGINLVINYDFPTSAVSYVHRIGRAGRAGNKGKAITFFTGYDNVILRKIARIIKDSGGDVPDYTLKLKKPVNNFEINQLKYKAPHRWNISTNRCRSRKGKSGNKSAPDTEEKKNKNKSVSATNMEKKNKNKSVSATKENMNKNRSVLATKEKKSKSTLATKEKKKKQEQRA